MVSSLPSDQPALGEQSEEVRAEFLRRFPHHTARAYRGDLEHVRAWSSASGQAFFELNDLLLFRCLLMLTRYGYSRSTTRCRITCLRAYVALVNRYGEVFSLDVDARSLCG